MPMYVSKHNNYHDQAHLVQRRAKSVKKMLEWDASSPQHTATLRGLRAVIVAVVIWLSLPSKPLHLHFTHHGVPALSTIKL